MLEFDYNNGYHDSLRMSLFEALYGRSCNNPICWSDPVNMVLIGLDMLAEIGTRNAGYQEESKGHTR